MIQPYNTHTHNHTHTHTHTNMCSSHHIKILYAGGTFGCHGTPLSPLSSEIFLPILFEAATANNMSAINNTIIKDSSQLFTADFFAYYTSIREQYQAGFKKIMIITGTDTLSYLSSFLYECFNNVDITLCLTASMNPLLFAEEATYILNHESDAWCNFALTTETVNNYTYGVYVCLDNQVFTGNSVQKLHSMSSHAFVGKIAEACTVEVSEPTIHSDSDLNPFHTHGIEKLKLNLFKYDITPVYLYPSPIESLIERINSLVQQADNKHRSACIILMGFGTGNIPYSDTLAELFQQCYEHNHMIFVTSQCSFDGVSRDYAAGSWLYEHHVLSCGSMTKEYIFSKIFWLSLISKNSQEIRKTWLEELS